MSPSLAGTYYTFSYGTTTKAYVCTVLKSKLNFSINYTTKMYCTVNESIGQNVLHVIVDLKVKRKKGS